MDIVLIFNGLGNQMSQYAFFLAKKRIDKRTKVIYFPDRYTSQHNGYELEKVFGIYIKKHSRSFWGHVLSLYQWAQICDSRKRHWLRVLMKTLGVSYQNESSYSADNNMIKSTNKGIRFLYGGWHCEDYFKSIADDIRELFSFDTAQLNEEGKTILKQIESTNSISVHIRRGDFLTDGFDGIATKEYYSKAFEYMNRLIDNPKYFVFSDDMKWTKENISGENMTYVEIHTGKESWKDMMLISKCKHNINANSTFSWWGAWLNSNQDKVVITPSKFNKNMASGNIYPNAWIKIS